MKARKFDEENLREVFKAFQSYDGYELKVCPSDDLIPRLHAFILCSNYTNPSGTFCFDSRSVISCSVLKYIPSNWYYFIGIDSNTHLPYIVFDGSLID